MGENNQTKLIGALVVASLTAKTHSLWLLDGFDAQTLNIVRQSCDYLIREGNDQSRKIAQKFLESDLSQNEEKMSRAWTSLFGLGRMSVTPHESVFRCGLAMQQPRDQTRLFMVKTGVKLGNSHGEPEDHLGVQLEFLSLLLEKGTLGEQVCLDYLSLARAFLEERLVWVSGFVRTIERDLALPPEDDRQVIFELLDLIVVFLEQTATLLERVRFEA